jgi:DNA polymerase III alpha subunit (gram-positive type)
MFAKNIGHLCLEENLITPHQLQDALQHQKETGLLLGAILVKLGYMSTQDVFTTLEKQRKLGYSEFSENSTIDISDKGILEIPITIIDIITTGFSPYSGAEIVQLGLLNVTGDKVQDKFTANIKTIKEMPHSTRVLYNINDSDIESAINFKDIISIISKHITNKPILAFNVKFVINFIIHYFKNFNIPFMHNEFLGLLTTWRMLYYGPDKGYRSLIQLCKFYNYPLSKPYNIDNSIDALHYVFIKLIEDIKDKKNIKTISQLKVFQNRTFRFSIN